MNRKRTFIDLFAGIGGIRTAFDSIGMDCVFTSEIDKYARKTYSANYGIPENEIHGDITKIESKDIPDFDVLIGGFPCQAFSLAGKRLGFNDARGTLFFQIARILNDKQPKAFLLENVKNLLHHDNGNTFRVIKSILENDLNYRVSYGILDGKHWVPQHRERIAIIGFKNNKDLFDSIFLNESFSFNEIEIPNEKHSLKEILHPEDGSEIPEYPYTNNDGTVNDKYRLSEKLWDTLKKHSEKHKALNHGFGFTISNPEDISRTLTARYYKDGSDILINTDTTPRRLTPRECARLMGYNDSFKIVVSDTQAYKQFGNSVVVPMMKAIAKAMDKYI